MRKLIGLYFVWLIVLAVVARFVVSPYVTPAIAESLVASGAAENQLDGAVIVVQWLLYIWLILPVVLSWLSAKWLYMRKLKKEMDLKRPFL
ncbi:hypothetical protein [Neptuniibacter sp. QD37_11]|uniref:hypothetical protein n=1 Tax=Neptuniibacter sp. QD37_11 TaxID=3398209 RepID=UPI0039F4D460